MQWPGDPLLNPGRVPRTSSSGNGRAHNRAGASRIRRGGAAAVSVQTSVRTTTVDRGSWPETVRASVEDGEQALDATVERGADAVDAVEVGAGHSPVAHHDEMPCGVLWIGAPR